MYVIGLAMGIASIVLSYTGLPEPHDAEPLLAIGLFLVRAGQVIPARQA